MTYDEDTVMELVSLVREYHGHLGECLRTLHAVFCADTERLTATEVSMSHERSKPIVRAMSRCEAALKAVEEKR